LAISSPERPGSPEPPEPPELFRWIPWLGHHLRREWPLIRTAPYTNISVAIATAVLIGTTVFLYQEHHYAERFATFEVNEKYLTRQLDDYKKAFPDKSPDEAAKEVGVLRKSLEDTEKHLDTLEKAVSLAEQERKKDISDIRENLRVAQRRPFIPWTLSADQKITLGKILDDEVKFSIPYRCLIGSTQSQGFTEDLLEFTRSHGWKMEGNCFGGLKADLIGILLAIPYESFIQPGCPVAESAGKILSMFTRAKIEMKIGYDDTLTCGQFWLGIANPAF
jgi:hypothetical protein